MACETGASPGDSREGVAADLYVPARSIREHEVKTLRGVLRYRSVTGFFDVPGEPSADGRFRLPRARLFLTSYLGKAANSDAGQRPIIFAFNGGPGSPSVWLHLGLVGPRRVIAVEGAQRLDPPYALVDNEETLLWRSDVVVIDAVNTGFSRMAEGEPVDAYHDVRRDVELFAEVIRLWLARNRRWGSPVFILGESYGVLRAAKVSERLISVHGLYPSGLILVSSTLGGDAMRVEPGSIIPAAAFLPSFAAVAHFHGKHPGRPLGDVLAEAESFAAGPYLLALARGSRLPRDEREATVEKVAHLTGLHHDYVDRVNFRVSNDRFFVELLRDQGRVVGRNDGRFTGWNPDGGGEYRVTDPAYDIIRGAYASAFNGYVSTELGFETDLPYEMTSQRVQPWRTGQEYDQGFSSIDALSRALRTFPGLGIHYSMGYYDLCTPYWGAEHEIAQLQIPSELTGNIMVDHYRSGHMIYLDEPSRVQLLTDIDTFVAQKTAQQGTVHGNAVQ